MEQKDNLYHQREDYVGQDINTEVTERQNDISSIEEYKRTAPQMLTDLGLLLCRYAQWGEDVFPRGLVNILNYTWKELTADAHPKTSSLSQTNTSKQRKERKSGVSLRKSRSKIHAKPVGNEPLESVDGPPTNPKQTSAMNDYRGKLFDPNEDRLHIKKKNVHRYR